MSGGVDRRIVLSTLAAMGLVGCTTLLPTRRSEPQVFRLTPKSTFPDGLPKVPLTLAVAEPSAERALDTSRIAFISDGTQVEYYADALWVDRAPSMVQGLIVLSFRQAGGFSLVATDRDRLRADLLLRSALRAFYTSSIGGAAPAARVGIDAALLRLPQRDQLATTAVTHETLIAGGGMAGVVGAFDTALGRCLRDLVVWTLGAAPSA
jgi:cholesterol transport system auxiliary component